ncbi:PTS glucose transporter subunit IICBA [Sesbania bispinosa]|nr:PTS glucose transporter subunit IICBA [Sesbania bispinosa]
MSSLSPTSDIGNNVPENSKSIFALNTQNSIKLTSTNFLPGEYNSMLFSLDMTSLALLMAQTRALLPHIRIITIGADRTN